MREETSYKETKSELAYGFSFELEARSPSAIGYADKDIWNPCRARRLALVCGSG